MQHTVIEQEFKKDLTGDEASGLLDAMGLPIKYMKAIRSERKGMRMQSLTSWFDEDKPHVLCTDTEKAVKATRLWCEYYIKPDSFNRGRYYYEDALCKYDMVRAAMSPSIKPELPAKCLVTASRRLSKTETLFHHLCSMIAINRPYTEILMAQINDKRTREEVRKMKRQIERNETIQRDFGGVGVLYPKRRSETDPWNQNELTFINNPDCRIIGHSLGSAQRGRGPLFILIDDPEDEECYSQEWRWKFFDSLFSDLIPFLHWGCKLLWIGTPVHQRSCLSLAFRGHSEQSGTEGSPEAEDKRFRLWIRRKYPLIGKDEEGNWYSNQPSRLSVEAFKIKLEELGPTGLMAELQCEPVNPGTRVFKYTRARHNYLICRGETGRYVYDCKTGRKIDFTEWFDSLSVLGAMDVADSQAADSDPGAVVIIGVDPQGVIWVLDAYAARVIADDLISMSYKLAEEWKAETLYCETNALQTVVHRLALRYAEDLREQGKSPPPCLPIENYKKNKVRRIIGMSPVFGNDEIRVPLIDHFEDANGTVHIPEENHHAIYFDQLTLQIETYTDRGTRMEDDLIDTLEMCVRKAHGIRGYEVRREEEHESDKIRQEWKEVGFNIPLNTFSTADLSPKMLEELRKDSPTHKGKPLKRIGRTLFVPYR